MIHGALKLKELGYSFDAIFNITWFMRVKTMPMKQTKYRIGYDSAGPSSYNNWEKIKIFFKKLRKEFEEEIGEIYDPEQ